MVTRCLTIRRDGEVADGDGQDEVRVVRGRCRVERLCAGREERVTAAGLACVNAAAVEERRRGAMRNSERQCWPAYRLNASAKEEDKLRLRQRVR